MEEQEEQQVDVPDWAVKVLQGAVRDYRYTGDYLPQSSWSKLQLRLRRGNVPVGRIEMTHAMRGAKHFLSTVFVAGSGKEVEPFKVVARSLDQHKDAVALVMERVCQYGCSKRRNWCADCSQAARHKIGQFRERAPTVTPATEPEGENATHQNP